jgi:glutamate-1-semialdehyde 2,1-aminomutase
LTLPPGVDFFRTMPFRRFFERGKRIEREQDEQSSVGDELETEGVEAESSDDDQEIEGDPEAAPEIEWSVRAAAVLPTGASTGSKRAEALYGDAATHGPTHFTRAVGCRVFDDLGEEYIDCTMALGSVALGYAEPNVTRAVVDAAANGNVSGLSPIREVEIAERLCDVIPCAEMVQFLKTGAEAVAAAVRIARTYTGRDVVIGSGYFGWHDWSSSAAGVPKGVQSDFRSVPFDDVPALEAAVSAAGAKLAAIVLEPVVERMPSDEWIARARALCDARGAVLIFDEVKTGFRLRTGGFQELSGVTPDLAAFGKAMANGYPLSAVVGQRAIMEAATRTWISSTLASESTALAACGAVLDWHAQAEICEALWSTGKELRASVTAAIEASGVPGVTVDGIDPMWLIRFDDPQRQRRFLELSASNGVLFKRGAYNFAALAHDEEIIRRIESAASAALVQLRDEEAHA